MKHYLMDVHGYVYYAETGVAVNRSEIIEKMNGDEAAWIGLRMALMTTADTLNKDILVDFGDWTIKVLGDFSNVFLREERHNG